MFNLRPPGQKPLLGTPIDWSAPLSQGLTMAWLMNEGCGDRVFDSTGNGNAGLLDGVFWISTEKGTTPAGDSANDYINLIDAHSFTGNFSIVSCVGPGSQTGRQQILRCNGVPIGFRYWIETNPIPRASLYNGSAYVYSDTGFTANEWAFIAVTNNIPATQISFYKNGQPDGTDPSAHSGATDPKRIL